MTFFAVMKRRVKAKAKARAKERARAERAAAKQEKSLVLNENGEVVSDDGGEIPLPTVMKRLSQMLSFDLGTHCPKVGAEFVSSPLKDIAKSTFTTQKNAHRAKGTLRSLNLYTQLRTQKERRLDGEMSLFVKFCEHAAKRKLAAKAYRGRVLKLLSKIQESSTTANAAINCLTKLKRHTDKYGRSTKAPVSRVVWALLAVVAHKNAGGDIQEFLTSYDQSFSFDTCRTEFADIRDAVKSEGPSKVVALIRRKKGDIKQSRQELADLKNLARSKGRSTASADLLFDARSRFYESLMPILRRHLNYKTLQDRVRLMLLRCGVLKELTCPFNGPSYEPCLEEFSSYKGSDDGNVDDENPFGRGASAGQQEGVAGGMQSEGNHRAECGDASSSEEDENCENAGGIPALNLFHLTQDCPIAVEFAAWADAQMDAQEQTILTEGRHEAGAASDSDSGDENSDSDSDSDSTPPPLPPTLPPVGWWTGSQPTAGQNPFAHLENSPPTAPWYKYKKGDLPCNDSEYAVSLSDLDSEYKYIFLDSSDFDTDRRGTADEDAENQWTSDSSSEPSDVSDEDCIFEYLQEFGYIGDEAFTGGKKVPFGFDLVKWVEGTHEMAPKMKASKSPPMKSAAAKKPAMKSAVAKKEPARKKKEASPKAKAPAPAAAKMQKATVVRRSPEKKKEDSTGTGTAELLSSAVPPNFPVPEVEKEAGVAEVDDERTEVEKEIDAEFAAARRNKKNFVSQLLSTRGSISGSTAAPGASASRLSPSRSKSTETTKSKKMASLAPTPIRTEVHEYLLPEVSPPPQLGRGRSLDFSPRADTSDDDMMAADEIRMQEGIFRSLSPEYAGKSRRSASSMSQHRTAGRSSAVRAAADFEEDLDPVTGLPAESRAGWHPDLEHRGFADADEWDQLFKSDGVSKSNFQAGRPDFRPLHSPDRLAKTSARRSDSLQDSYGQRRGQRKSKPSKGLSAEEETELNEFFFDPMSGSDGELDMWSDIDGEYEMSLSGDMLDIDSDSENAVEGTAADMDTGGDWRKSVDELARLVSLHNSLAVKRETLRQMFPGKTMSDLQYCGPKRWAFIAKLPDGLGVKTELLKASGTFLDPKFQSAFLPTFFAARTWSGDDEAAQLCGGIEKVRENGYNTLNTYFAKFNTDDEQEAFHYARGKDWFARKYLKECEINGEDPNALNATYDTELQLFVDAVSTLKDECTSNLKLPLDMQALVGCHDKLVKIQAEVRAHLLGLQGKTLETDCKYDLYETFCKGFRAFLSKKFFKPVTAWAEKMLARGEPAARVRKYVERFGQFDAYFTREMPTICHAWNAWFTNNRYGRMVAPTTHTVAKEVKKKENGDPDAGEDLDDDVKEMLNLEKDFAKDNPATKMKKAPRRVKSSTKKAAQEALPLQDIIQGVDGAEDGGKQDGDKKDEATAGKKEVNGKEADFVEAGEFLDGVKSPTPEKDVKVEKKVDEKAGGKKQQVKRGKSVNNADTKVEDVGMDGGPPPMKKRGRPPKNGDNKLEDDDMDGGLPAMKRQKTSAKNKEVDQTDVDMDEL
eukprot:g10462.t1